MNSTEIAKYIIEHNNFMTISTADASGKPWISPVGFVYDDNYNLFWVSYKNALHSANIRNRKEVAIVIFGQMPQGNFDGVYIAADAVELTDEVEIQTVINLFKVRRPQPSRFETESFDDVSNNAAWRMYKAKPIEISKRTDDTVNGQAITVREIIHM